MPPQKRVVAYCRVSTLEQKKKGHGIEIQIRDVTLFSQSQGLFIDRFYKDEGKSGADERRPSLKRLLRDARSGEIGTVIIPSLDRLSRNVRLAENFFWKFERLGVKILIGDMPTYNGQDRKDVLIRQIREAIAEENRKDIIERLAKGRQERVRSGKAPGGNVPYGYRRNEGTFRRHEKEAEIIRLIFRLAREGNSRMGIARTLTEGGERRRNGKPWTARQVSAILGREKLYQGGIVHYGEVSGKDAGLILLRCD
ncbi:MAG: recombinase family protein [Nitrososphaera sp.]|nr:recombinase family protein [Nitrososphaera sp.]